MEQKPAKEDSPGEKQTRRRYQARYSTILSGTNPSRIHNPEESRSGKRHYSKAAQLVKIKDRVQENSQGKERVNLNADNSRSQERAKAEEGNKYRSRVNAQTGSRNKDRANAADERSRDKRRAIPSAESSRPKQAGDVHNRSEEEGISSASRNRPTQLKNRSRELKASQPIDAAYRTTNLANYPGYKPGQFMATSRHHFDKMSKSRGRLNSFSRQRPHNLGSKSRGRINSFSRQRPVNLESNNLNLEFYKPGALSTHYLGNFKEVRGGQPSRLAQNGLRMHSPQRFSPTRPQGIEFSRTGRGREGYCQPSGGYRCLRPFSPPRAGRNVDRHRNDYRQGVGRGYRPMFSFDKY